MPDVEIARVGDTHLFILEDLEELDVETMVWADLSAPTSIKLRVAVNGLTIAEYDTPNQVGATNSWNQLHTFDRTGNHSGQWIVTHGAAVKFSEPDLVPVKASLAALS